MDYKPLKRRKDGQVMKNWWKRFWVEEDGIGTVEMILILVVKCTPYMDVY